MKLFFLNPAMPIAILFGGYVFYAMILNGFELSGFPLITSIYLGTLYLWTALAIFFQGSLEARANYLDLIMLFFICTMGISFAISGDSELAKYFFPLVILPYIAGRLLPVSLVNIFIMMMVVLGILASLTSIFETSMLIQGWHNITTRPSLYGSPVNTVLLGLLVGVMLLMLVAFMLSSSFSQLYDRNPILVYMILLITPLVCFYFIILGNKTAVLSTFSISVLLLVVAREIAMKQRVLVFILLTVSIFGSIFAMPENVIRFYKYQNISEIIHALEGKYTGFADLFLVDEKNSKDVGALVSENDSMAVRIVLWRKALKAMSANYIFGIGAGETARLNIKPHNIIIQAFVELGVVGGGLLAVFYCIVCYFFIFGLIRGYFTNTVLWFVAPLFGYYFIFAQLMGNLCRDMPSFILAGMAVSLYGAYLQGNVVFSKKEAKFI